MSGVDMENFNQFDGQAAMGDWAQTFEALNALIQREVGAIICSCSTFDPVASKARRIYTNQPAAYPLSGLKEVTPNRWTRQVLDEGQMFVANSLDEIAGVFPDYELIGSLGCGSVVNLPIRLSGSFLGTVNMLHEPGHFTQKTIEKISQFGGPAIIAFCAHKMANNQL
ncbi:MAG: GAF domain-containing protein [Marinosulfonomonas sp.]|nr:GAF domain-containing protein [Marinosulfonomonas sp.]